jgi:hypothetical protein
MAAMAEYEAKAISARTKGALAASKRKLGGLRWDITKVAATGRQASLRTRREKAAKYQADIIPIIVEKMKAGRGRSAAWRRR